MALSRAKGFAAGEDMPESSSKLTRYRFGPFDLDPGEGTLTRHGIRVRLQDLPYRLLVMLVEKSGEVVTREELRQHLWPQNTFVEFDNSLGVAIRKVRESLNDNADAPQYVETIPRRGYRFVAPVIVETRGMTVDTRSEPGEVGLPPQPPADSGQQLTGSSKTRLCPTQHLLAGGRVGIAPGGYGIAFPVLSQACRCVPIASSQCSCAGKVAPLGSGAGIPQFARSP